MPFSIESDVKMATTVVVVGQGDFDTPPGPWLLSAARFARLSRGHMSSQTSAVRLPQVPDVASRHKLR